MKHTALSAVLLFMADMALAEEVNLRCEYIDEHQMQGVVVIARIGQYSVVREFHDSKGVFSELTHAIVERSDRTIRTMRMTPQGERMVLLFDRLSGHLTEYREVMEQDRESIWNNEKQQLGGFDPGKTLWLINVLLCERIKKAF